MKHTINRRDLDRLTERLSDLLNDDVESVVDYSGRGMFGSECVGWTHRGGVTEFGAAMAVALVTFFQDHGMQEPDEHLFNLGNADEDLADVVRFASEARQDNMGWNTISYFPNLQYEREQVPEITATLVRSHVDVRALMQSTEHPARTDEERIAILAGQVAEALDVPMPHDPSAGQSEVLDALFENSRLVLESEGWVS